MQSQEQQELLAMASYSPPELFAILRANAIFLLNRSANPIPALSLCCSASACTACFSRAILRANSLFFLSRSANSIATFAFFQFVLVASSRGILVLLLDAAAN